MRLLDIDLERLVIRLTLLIVDISFFSIKESTSSQGDFALAFDLASPPCVQA
jgi:hypothetical protein